MTKIELLQRYDTLLAEKGMCRLQTFSGTIGNNSNKAELKNAIDCLMTSDEEMYQRLEKFKTLYEHSYNAIVNAGNFLTHRHNRLYVYNSIK